MSAPLLNVVYCLVAKNVSPGMNADPPIIPTIPTPSFFIAICIIIKENVMAIVPIPWIPIWYLLLPHRQCLPSSTRHPFRRQSRPFPRIHKDNHKYPDKCKLWDKFQYKHQQPRCLFKKSLFHQKRLPPPPPLPPPKLADLRRDLPEKLLPGNHPK